VIEWIEDHNHFIRMQQKYSEYMILLFYAKFSSHAKRALTEIELFSKENEDIPVGIIDVEKVKGLHKQFGVENIPTVLSIKKGKASLCIEGVENAKFYARVFTGMPSSQRSTGKKTVSHRVIVYSGPGCPACGTAQSYLRKKGIQFRTIDISRDQRAAERLFQRSGQMVVPQIDIDGHLVVGFNQGKIDKLLSS